MTNDIKARLRILRSDLADTTNPRLLEKYPHLGNPENAEQLRAQIKSLEAFLGQRKKLNGGENE